MKTRISLPRQLAATVVAVLAATSLHAGAAPAGAEPAAAAAPASQASQPQPNDGSDYVAAWTVMSEICEDKYPQLKPLVDEFWTKRGNRQTRERVANIKSAPDFPGRVAKLRKTLNARKDEVLAQCGQLFSGGAH